MHPTSAMTADDHDARPLDLVHLSGYTLGDRNLERELLGLFRTQADIYAARLESAASGSRDWRDAAHGLKGSARALGAWALGDIAEEAEHLPEQSPTRTQTLARIHAAIATVNAFIAERMK